MSDRQTVTVKLKRPIVLATETITEVVVQEPTANDYFALGNPQTWVRATGGMALVENDAAIKAYVERLIIKPDPLIAMRQMSLLDAIAVKDAVLGFFTEPTPSADS